MSIRMPSGINHWMEIDPTASNGRRGNLYSVWFPINRASFECDRVYAFFVAYRTCAICLECRVYQFSSLVVVFSGH